MDNVSIPYHLHEQPLPSGLMDPEIFLRIMNYKILFDKVLAEIFKFL